MQKNLIEKGKCTGRKYKEGKKMYRLKKKFLELKAEHDNNIQQREKEKCRRLKKRIKDKENKLNDELSKVGKLEKRSYPSESGSGKEN